MEEENVAIRLKFFMDYSGISNSQFADSCGIPRPTVSQLLNGRNKKISDVLIGMIHRGYPELSIMWLLFGEGEMLVADNAVSDIENGGESSPPEGSGSSINISAGDDCNHDNKSVYASDSELKQGLESDALLSQKLVFRKEERRVVSITVFYDDSSYETFIPSSK